MQIIETERLILRPFMDADYDDLYEFLAQLAYDEFEGYPGITYENGKEHLKYRLSSEEFLAMELKDSGKVIGNIYCGKRDDMSSHGSPVIHPGSYCIYAPGDTPLMLGIIPCIR